MTGCGWSWVAGVKLWLVVGGGDKSIADRGWWRRNYAWSWIVAGGGGKIIAGSGSLYDSVMPLFQKHLEPVFFTTSLRRWNLHNSGNVIFTIDIVFSESEWLFHMVNGLSLISHG